MITIEEKAAILDWLLTPVDGRADRPARIERTANRNKLQALYTFRVWGSVEEFLKTVKEQME
jgi:hypothetical protein